MSTRIQNIGRDEYIASIENLSDPENRRFAAQALAWWDRHFSWRAQGCDVLIGEDDAHLSYLFSKTDRYHEYLTVYNLFTPSEKRRSGYAHELLERTVRQAAQNHTRRITFSSVSASLDFYLDLGFVFWGVNDIGDYYCDLPIPKEGLEGMREMIRSRDVESLIGPKMEKIYGKVYGNKENLSPIQSVQNLDDQLKMGNQCKFEALMEFKAACDLPL